MVVLRFINQMVLQGEVHQLNGGFALQFAKHVGAVHVHGFMAQCQALGNGFDADTRLQQIEHLTFTRGDFMQDI